MLECTCTAVQRNARRHQQCALSEHLWAEAGEAADHVLANELARAWLVRALVDVDTLRARHASLIARVTSTSTTRNYNVNVGQFSYMLRLGMALCAA